MFPSLSKCIQRKQLVLKTYIYVSTKAGVQQWLGGRLWDKEVKAERLLKSSPWRELLDVSDRTSVSESLWEAHVKRGFWRGRDCASGACMRASERQEKASDNKWTSQGVGGCSQALVTATRIISKRTALLCHGKGTSTAGRTGHARLVNKWDWFPISASLEGS